MLSKRKQVITAILSMLFTLFVIIGTTFFIGNSFKFIEKHILVNLVLTVVCLIGFYKVFNLLFAFLDKFNVKDKKKSKKRKWLEKIDKLLIRIENTKAYNLFLKHPFLFSMIALIICWLPYIICFYPAILSPDPSFQIKQFFGIPNKYSTYVVLLDESQIITAHHPVVHTLLLGGCLKLGTLVNSANLGLFLYSIIQILILSGVLAYTIKFLKELNLPKRYLFLALLIYCFVPLFPFYAMSTVKDVIFGSLVIIYIMVIYKLVKTTDIKVRNIFLIILLLILVVLFRNNGIHTILLSFPFLFLVKGTLKKKVKLLIILISIITFNYSYNNIILPHFKITPTSIREVLSIPFQQTARYVKTYPDEVTNKEKEVIDRVLIYDTLASRYDVDISDPVKNEFNRYTTDEELKAYFEVWYQQFLKHPVTYLEATLNNTYGYFYPLKTRWFIYYGFDDRIVEDGFNYHYNGLVSCRRILSTFGRGFPYIPILGLLVNIAFNVWVLIIMASYLFYKKKYSSIIYMLPSFVLILVCFASPVNTYFRYALPFVFALMLDVGIFIKEGVLDEKR